MNRKRTPGPADRPLCRLPPAEDWGVKWGGLTNILTLTPRFDIRIPQGPTLWYSTASKSQGLRKPPVSIGNLAFVFLLGGLIAIRGGRGGGEVGLDVLVVGFLGLCGWVGGWLVDGLSLVGLGSFDQQFGLE